jgi:hypothetical protein
VVHTGVGKDSGSCDSAATLNTVLSPDQGVKNAKENLEQWVKNSRTVSWV